MSIAAVILTRNEERHIAQVIASARQVTEEIIVIDSGSTDNTLAIAKELGVRIFTRALDDDFAAQRNFAADKTAADYLLHIDADERLTPELAANIRRAAEQGGKIYTFRRHNVLFGQEIRYGAFHPDVVRRLYPRGGARWQGRVHESLTGGLPEENLPGKAIHYTYDNLEQYFNKLNHYSTLWAKEAREKGKRASLAGGMCHAVFAFFKAAAWQAGLLDGFLGFNLCCLHSMYTLVKYWKLYILQRQVPYEYR